MTSEVSMSCVCERDSALRLGSPVIKLNIILIFYTARRRQRESSGLCAVNIASESGTLMPPTLSVRMHWRRSR